MISIASVPHELCRCYDPIQMLHGSYMCKHVWLHVKCMHLAMQENFSYMYMNVNMSSTFQLHHFSYMLDSHFSYMYVYMHVNMSGTFQLRTCTYIHHSISFEDTCVMCYKVGGISITSKRMACGVALIAINPYLLAGVSNNF